MRRILIIPIKDILMKHNPQRSCSHDVPLKSAYSRLLTRLAKMHSFVNSPYQSQLALKPVFGVYSCLARIPLQECTGLF